MCVCMYTYIKERERERQRRSLSQFKTPQRTVSLTVESLKQSDDE